MPRERQICLTHWKLSKKFPNQCETIFLLCIFRVFGQVWELSPSGFEKFIIFLAIILIFRFGRADLPSPGHDRVKGRSTWYILLSGNLLGTKKSWAAAIHVLRKLGSFVAELDWPRPSYGSTSNWYLADWCCWCCWCCSRYEPRHSQCPSQEVKLGVNHEQYIKFNIKQSK